MADEWPHNTRYCTCLSWLRLNAQDPEDIFTRRDPYCPVHGIDGDTARDRARERAQDVELETDDG